MQKRLIYIVSLVLLSASISAHTNLNPEVTHFVALHGDAGYSSLLHTMESRTPAAGVNSNIGIDYRLQYNNFVFSIGAEGMYELNINHIGQLTETIKMIDTEGEAFDMHVQVDKSRDLTHMANVNIPILFGGEWKRFYFLVGPKVSLNVYGATSSKALVTTYGEYDRYYDDFYNMENHQFVSGQPMGSATLPMKWNFNVMAHLEIGGRIGHMFRHKQFRLNPDKVRMYLAGYVDFGLLNLHSNRNGKPLFDYQETDHGVQFYIQPLLLSNMSDGVFFRNMNVGIKFTVAFEMPKHGKSYIYDYKRVERDYRKRGGNQGIK